MVLLVLGEIEVGLLVEGVFDVIYVYELCFGMVLFLLVWLDWLV